MKSDIIDIDDLENVLYDLDNGEIFSGIAYLRSIIKTLRKENDNG